MTPVDVWTACTANGIMATKQQIDSLKRYHDELLYWNQRVNMVSRKDEQNLWERHILHSLVLLKYVDIPEKARVLDVGTGGGLPGIPIKIVRPDVKMLLVDSIRKKTSLAEMFASHTGLKDVTAINARVEDLATDPHYLRAFDVIISRAVASTSQIISWTRGLSKPKAVFAFLKGGDLAEEIEEARLDHRDMLVEEVSIDVFGVPWFAEEQKKVVLCRFSS